MKKIINVTNGENRNDYYLVNCFFYMFISIETRIWGNLLVGTFQCSNVVSECGCLNNYTHS